MGTKPMGFTLTPIDNPWIARAQPKGSPWVAHGGSPWVARGLPMDGAWVARRLSVGSPCVVNEMHPKCAKTYPFKRQIMQK